VRIRPSSQVDRSDIYETVQRSFRTSYALGRAKIETILASEFSPTELTVRIESPGSRLFVAATSESNDPGAGVLGFVDLGPDPTLRWLYAHPGDRSRGGGTALVERVRDGPSSRLAPFAARILESPRGGERFLDRFEPTWTGSTIREAGSREFRERLYASGRESRGADESPGERRNGAAVDDRSRPRDVEMEGTAGGVETPGDEDESSETDAPFYVVYESEEHEKRAGFFCSRCGTADVSRNVADRLECNECENTYRLTDWDLAHL